MYLDVTDDGNVLHEKLMLIFYPLILSLFIFLFFYSRLSCVCTLYRRALTQHKLHNFSFYVCCCLTLCRCDVPEEQMFPLSFFCLHRIISTLWQIKNDIITENDSRGDHKLEFQMIG